MMNFFKNAFKKRQPVSKDVATAPLSEEQLRSVSYIPVEFFPAHYVFGCAQSIGKVRDHNEDSIYTLSTVLSDSQNTLPFGIFIVADGMGGHQHGEAASGTAVRVMSEYLISHIYKPHFGSRSEGQTESLQELMQNGVAEAQQAVSKRVPGGGTTLTVSMVIGEQITVSHVGDSRLYFIHPDGRVQIVTQDHSLVRRLVELGQLTEEEAAVHPQRNVLYRAIGQAEPFTPDINTLHFPTPGYVMMCSDGLWGVVPESEILRIIKSSSNLSQACYDLVAAANELGGPDNISVILIQYLN